MSLIHSCRMCCLNVLYLFIIYSFQSSLQTRNIVLVFPMEMCPFVPHKDSWEEGMLLRVHSPCISSSAGKRLSSWRQGPHHFLFIPTSYPHTNSPFQLSSGFWQGIHWMQMFSFLSPLAAYGTTY